MTTTVPVDYLGTQPFTEPSSQNFVPISLQTYLLQQIMSTH